MSNKSTSKKTIEDLPSPSMPSTPSKLSDIRKFLSPPKDNKPKKGKAKKTLKKGKAKYQSIESAKGSSDAGGSVLEVGKPSQDHVKCTSDTKAVGYTNLETTQTQDVEHKSISSTVCGTEDIDDLSYHRLPMGSDVESCGNPVKIHDTENAITDPVKDQGVQSTSGREGSSVGSCSAGKMADEDESQRKMVQTNLCPTQRGIKVILSPTQVQKKKGKKTKKEELSKKQTRITNIFPVRKSNRKTKYQQERDEQARITKAILSKSFEGLEVRKIEGKGRGVFASRDFQRNEFVCEYSGELISHVEAKKREKQYGEDDNIGCYMYYLQSNNKKYCIDATAEDGTLGRLINHSRSGNCKTRVHVINHRPHLIFIATCDVKAGEELSYDYGDRSKDALSNHPWLRF